MKSDSIKHAFDLYQAGQLEAAEAVSKRIIANGEDSGRALLLCGMIAQQRAQTPQAIDLLRQAVAAEPEEPAAYKRLAMSLQVSGRSEEALAELRTAVARAPARADAWKNLIGLLASLGRTNELARVEAEQAAFRKRIGAIEARFDQACKLLLKGNYEDGWKAFESRLEAPEFAALVDMPCPRWRGEPLEGRSILLRCEQGHGDSLQFFRYVQAVIDRGADVTVETWKDLARLFRMNTSAAIHVKLKASEAAPQGYDFYCPMMSLPYVLGTRLDTIPGRTSYLAAEPALVRKWCVDLKDDGRFRVGLVWAGGRRLLNPAMVSIDQRRSLEFSAFERLLDIAGMAFYSLQKQEAAEQARGAVESGRLIDRTDELADFADTAALIESLDLVIAVDTAVAHLAAAMNKPTWILSRFDGCWRWLEDREDSPWYPSVRLFRQKTPGDWDEVMVRVHKALAFLATNQGLDQAVTGG
ncbi:MAG: tetratricopeptide repeat protein [Nevskia sp.]|nr:tetratricopeptide repeat protein [Nevskia sp.]